MTSSGSFRMLMVRVSPGRRYMPVEWYLLVEVDEISKVFEILVTSEVTSPDNEIGLK